MGQFGLWNIHMHGLCRYQCIVKCIIGAHRTLGPSVTRVRSTNIDGWFQENVEVMDSIGNSVANSYWEYSLPKQFMYSKYSLYYSKPTINAGLDALIRFVQEKYVKKKYIP